MVRHTSFHEMGLHRMRWSESRWTFSYLLLQFGGSSSVLNATRSALMCNTDVLPAWKRPSSASSCSDTVHRPCCNVWMKTEKPACKKRNTRALSRTHPDFFFRIANQLVAQLDMTTQIFYGSDRDASRAFSVPNGGVQTRSDFFNLIIYFEEYLPAEFRWTPCVGMPGLSWRRMRAIRGAACASNRQCCFVIDEPATLKNNHYRGILLHCVRP